MREERLYEVMGDKRREFYLKVRVDEDEEEG